MCCRSIFCMQVLSTTRKSEGSGVANVSICRIFVNITPITGGRASVRGAGGEEKDGGDCKKRQGRKGRNGRREREEMKETDSRLKEITYEKGKEETIFKGYQERLA